VAELVKQGLEALRAEKWDLAAEKYQAAMLRDENSAEAYAGLTRAFLAKNMVSQAFEIASNGVKAAPASALTHTALGEAYFRRAEMVEAEKQFLDGINAPHPDPRAYLGLARLYEAYSLRARARQMLNKARQLDPDDPDILWRWLQTLAVRDRIPVLEKYVSALKNDTPEDIQKYLSELKDRAKKPALRCRLATTLASTETKLQPLLIDPTHLHGYGLIVKINGESSRLLLDTGASGLLINRKLAQKAGIQSLAAATFGGIGDKKAMQGYMGVADTIKIGDLEFHQCPVQVSDERSILHDDGLIGADVFGHYLVTIDFLWQKLKLEELPKRPGEQAAAVVLDTQKDLDSVESGEANAPKDSAAASSGNQAPGPRDRYVAPEMQSYTKIFRFGHELLIPTRVGDAPPKLFLIDTGAMMSSISPAAAREVTKVRSDDTKTVKGLSGSVKDVYSADKAVLQFSHFLQPHQDLTTFDLSGISRNTGTEVSGILGFTTLRFFTLKIDYRDGLVDFYYNSPDTKK
jgi:tetratricopeptide (TPR) repeat protein